MSDPVQRFLAALKAHGCEPRPSGEGWACRCPAHDDRNPSLSIGTGNDGRALVRCHAGCPPAEVCASVGLTLADLFPEGSRRTGKARRRGDGDETPRRSIADGGCVAVATKSKPKPVFPTAAEAMAHWERSNGPAVATWTYTDAAGGVVGIVGRFEARGRKTYRPVSRSADGAGWTIEGMPKPHLLYQLPDLLAAPPGSRVWVCEGEKSADAARAVGLVATTSPHGCESASKADWSPLRGRDVVVLPDHDDAGEKYAADVVRLTIAAGARSVRVVRLVDLWAGMPEGGDIVDYAEHRGGDAEAIRAEVDGLAGTTEPEVAEEVAGATPRFEPFPLRVLPEPVRSFVEQTAEAIGCDASYIALPLLYGLASAIGNTHRIALKRGWTEPAIVWTAIVGESGTHKTPAFKTALRSLRKAQDDAMREHTWAMEEWKSAHLRYETVLAQWKRDVSRSKPDDAYTVAPPEEPVMPIARRYIVSDTTTEALAPILLGNPRGVLLARDELAGWLGSFDRYAKSGRGGADSAHWLSMHNGEAMTIDRKSGVPPMIHVPSASVSIAGGIQPAILARAMGREHHESGLLARLLFALPPRKTKQWTEAELDPSTEAALSAVFERLLGLSPNVDDAGSLHPQVLALTSDGRKAWVEFYNDHAREQAELTGDEAAAWSKLEGYAARLALVIHLCRWAADDPTLTDPTRVDEASIAAGVGLSRWFGNEARRVYAVLGESEEAHNTRQLTEWIVGKGGSVTVRDLTRGPREFRGNPEHAAKALDELVAAGVAVWVHDDHGPKGGRPTERVRLVSRGGDTGDGDETPRAGTPGGGSVTVATVAKPTDAGDGWGEL